MDCTNCSTVTLPNASTFNETSTSSDLFCSRSIKAFWPVERAFFGYFLPCLSLFGIFANIINIIVLTDRRLSARTYTYLAFLSAMDMITLILYFVDLLAKVHFAGQFWHEIFTSYIYLPIGSVTTTSSLLLKVAFTIDRFVYVRNPKIKSAALASRETYFVKLLSIGLILSSAIINLPRMFALSVDFETGCRSYRPYAQSSGSWFGIYSYVRLVLLNVDGIILLAVFNVMLIVLVHRSSARSHRESSISSAPSRNNHSSQQRSLTLTLIAATVLALCGEIPSTLFNRTSAGVLWGSGSVMNRQPFRSFVLMAYTLLLIEYSGNFVTYFLLNKKFRSLLLIKFCPRLSSTSLQNDHDRTSRCQRISSSCTPFSTMGGRSTLSGYPVSGGTSLSKKTQNGEAGQQDKDENNAESAICEEVAMLATAEDFSNDSNNNIDTDQLT